MFTLKTKIAILKAMFCKKSPFYIQFYVSKRCHLNCKMCNIVESNKELSPFPGDKIEKIATNLVKIGAGVVLLTGGEPFLRNDIAEIVRVFKQKKLDVRLQTAGLYERKNAIKECSQYGARDINISLDSLDEGLSDYINGVEGSWRKAIKTISFVSQTFAQKDSICALGTVLSKFNLDEVEPLLEFATRIGWWISLVPVHITQRHEILNFRGYDSDFSFREDDFPRVDALIERLKILKKHGAQLFDSTDYLNSVASFVRCATPSWRHNGICDSPNLYFAIRPDGSFAPCCDHSLDETLYVYDDNFPRIYKSREFLEKVKKITSNCPGCNFGSYPEMTLSARSFSTIKERILLQIRAGRSSVKPYTEEELYGIIAEIKTKYLVYSTGQGKSFKRAQKYYPEGYRNVR